VNWRCWSGRSRRRSARSRSAAGSRCCRTTRWRTAWSSRSSRRRGHHGPARPARRPRAVPAPAEAAHPRRGAPTEDEIAENRRAAPARLRGASAFARTPDERHRPAPRGSGRSGGLGRLSAMRGSSATAARTPFVVLVVTLLAGGLISLLLLNSAVNSDSFELNKLQNDTTGYTDEQQALQQEVDGYSAPDELERRARELGMVPGGNPAFLNPDGTVRGTPESATAPPARRRPPPRPRRLPRRPPRPPPRPLPRRPPRRSRPPRRPAPDR